MWTTVLAVLVGLLVLWVLLVAALYVRSSPVKDEPGLLRDVVRLLPDVVSLVRRLAADPALPRGVRWRLLALLGYLLLPLDLVPDVVPVVGYADDAIVLALVLRSVVRAAGPEALDRHWQGSPRGLALVRRLVGLQAS